MADVFGISLEELLDESKKIKTDQSTNHRNMIIIFGIVIFVVIIMESYVAVIGRRKFFVATTNQ